MGDSMDSIKMKTLSLCRFHKDNKYHMIFLKKLISDKTITARFNGFLPNLTKNYDDDILGKGFFVVDEKNLIGYVDIGNYSEDERSVYIRQAIDIEKRGKSYGKRTLSEISDLIFCMHPEVENIKAKVANDNIACLRMLSDCGYKWLHDDYYALENPYIKNSNKK